VAVFRTESNGSSSDARARLASSLRANAGLAAAAASA
jgi:hypothetical protein